jgi:ankyrin repeat protein
MMKIKTKKMKENNLICAVFHNDINYVRKHLGNYKDIKHITDPFGNTVYHIAAKMGYEEMLKLLLGEIDKNEIDILKIENNKSKTVISFIPENLHGIDIIDFYRTSIKLGVL